MNRYFEEQQQQAQKSQGKENSGLLMNLVHRFDFPVLIIKMKVCLKNSLLQKISRSVRSI